MSLGQSITAACKEWQKHNNYVLPLRIGTILTPYGLPNSTSVRTPSRRRYPLV